MPKYILIIEQPVYAESALDAEELGFIYLRDMLNSGRIPEKWTITDAKTDK